MTSFLEELKKSNLQEGINKTGAGFQLPQIQPQVPQGQMLPQIQPLEDILTPEMVAQRAAARGGAGVPAVQPDPSLSRVDRFFKETIPGAVSGISELFSPLDEAASVYGERAQQKREEQAIGTAETFRKAGALKDVMLKEGSPTFSEAFEARGGTLMPQTPEAAAPTPEAAASAPAGTVMAPPPAAESVATGGVQPSPSTEGSPQANFEARKATGKQFTPEEIAQAEALAKSMGTTFDPETGYSRQPFLDAQAPQVQAPAGEPTTQSGIPLSQFLSGEAIPEAGLRAEAPVFSSESRGFSGVAGQDIMARASAEREARAEAQFGEARGPDSSDRDRRMASGEGTSMADLTDMAKANARGASPRDVARGQKIADELGVDLKTGKPLETQDNGGMTAYQAATLAQKDRDFNYEVFKEQKGEVAAKAESQKRASLAASDAMRQNQNIMDTAREAGKNIGITTTGVGGALLGIIPGTGAFDQKSTVDTLQADAAFTALQNMRDSSPTGGALGQVSERELKLLSSNVRNLDHKQSPEQFRKNLAEYVKLRNQSMANMYRAYATDFSPEEANAAFGVGGIEDFGVAQSGGTSGIKNDRDVATTADSLLEKY